MRGLHRRPGPADPAAARPGFRPDIQGLRALAVLLVVLDHARIGPFHGGFVGVDVFFVISGYLITSLLLSEAERTGRVSLVQFWARRAKRILPAATLVLAATVAAGYVLLNAIVALRLFKDAVWAAFFAANVRFASTETDYFAQDEAVSPIQHFWSLAVEEQFYLVWPLLVAALVAWWGVRGRSRRAVGLTVAVLSLASFGWALVSVRSDLAGAYFSTPARAWELGLGALAAAGALQVRRLPPQLLAGASWLGLGMVAVAALRFTESTQVPGAPALLPVVGAALLLGGGSAPAAWGPQRLLSLPPARWVGDRSYSFYLWHWPALVLAAAVWRVPSGWSGVAVALGALVLADLSYRFVENPFRTWTWLRPRWRGVMLYPASIALLAVVVGLAQVSLVRSFAQERPAVTVSAYGQDDGQRADFSADPDVALVEASVLAAENDVAVPSPLEPAALGLADRVAAELGDCEYFDQPFPLPLCPMADTDSDRVLVGLGDSHLRHWIPALTQIAEQAGFRAYWLVYQGCTPAAVTPWLARSQQPDEPCADFHAWSQQAIEELSPDVVVMSTDVERTYVDDDGEVVDDGAEVAALIEQGMTDRIRSVQPYADRVIVLGDPPHLQMDPDVISDRGATLADGLSDPESRSMRMRRAVKAGTKAAGGAEYVDTRKWLCAYDKCPVVIGDYITRRDPAHLTLEYAAHLAGPLGRALKLG